MLGDYDKFLLKTCSRPVTVMRGLQKIKVPCGCCPTCRSRINYHISSKIIYNTSCIPNRSYYASFSFAPKHLPYLHYSIDFESRSFSYHFYNNLKKQNEYYVIDLDNTILEHLEKYFETCSSDIFYKNKRTSRYDFYHFDNKRYKVFSSGHVAICDAYIFRMFLKALRKDLWSTFSQRFKIVYCCEYGGKQFRPHFHAIFTLQENAVTSNFTFADDFHSLLDKHWQFGGVYFSGLVNSTFAPKYISQYICDNSSLPVFLRNSTTRQKIRHSIHYCPSVNADFLQTFFRHPSYVLDELAQRASDTVSASVVPQLLYSSAFKFPIRKFLQYPQFIYSCIEKFKSLRFNSFDDFVTFVTLYPDSFIGSHMKLFGVDLVTLSDYTSVVPFCCSYHAIISKSIPDFIVSDAHRLYGVSKYYKEHLSRLFRLYQSLWHIFKLYLLVSDSFSPFSFVNILFKSINDFDYSTLIRQYHDINLLSYFPQFNPNTYYYEDSLSTSDKICQKEILSNFVKHKEVSNLTFFADH